MNTSTSGQASAFLGRALTADYKPNVISSPQWWWDHRPCFTWDDVERMRRDPRIQFGLRILRAPVFNVRVTIHASNPDVAAWVMRAWSRFRNHDLIKALKMLEYGSAGGELLWRLDPETGYIEYDRLRDLYITDMRPLECDGKLSGISIPHLLDPQGGKLKLRSPRAFWIANEPEFGKLYGCSRLAGAWEPYMEKRGRHGAVDIRRLWYVKNAYRGGKIRHPPGTVEVETGVFRSNQDCAREIAEKVETGGIMVLSNVRDEHGNFLWDYEEPTINGDLTGVREYVKDLDIEQLEGMGIPAEVVQAAETGSGWSGRSVPFIVFLTGEDQIADTVLQAFDQQIARPGVQVNFGPGVDYTIEAESLVQMQQNGPPQQSGISDGRSVEGNSSSVTSLSLGPTTDRSATESASRLVDAIIDQGAAASMIIADEIRQKVRALVKKKFPSTS